MRFVLKNKSCVGSITTRSRKKRKDGAPSALMADTNIIRKVGRPPILEQISG
jgi:hypothetical protein